MVRLTVPLARSMSVVWAIAICWPPKVLRMISRPLDKEA